MWEELCDGTGEGSERIHDYDRARIQHKCNEEETAK